MPKKYQVVSTIFYGGEQIEDTFNSCVKAKALAEKLNSQNDLYAYAEVREIKA